YASGAAGAGTAGTQILSVSAACQRLGDMAGLGQLVGQLEQAIRLLQPFEIVEYVMANLRIGKLASVAINVLLPQKGTGDATLCGSGRNVLTRHGQTFGFLAMLLVFLP